MIDFNLLYGFNDEQTAEKLSRALRALGYKANAYMRPSKPLIKDYLLKQNDLNGVILKENLDGGDVFSIDEFVELADNINVNFVILISSKHRGKDDMKRLYAAGILNAYFLDGKVGADPKTFYPGLVVAGRVVEVRSNRLLVDILGLGILGFCRIENWRKVYTRTFEGLVQKGRIYDFEITRQAPKKKGKDYAFELSAENLSPDPWENLPEEFTQVNSVIMVKCLEKPTAPESGTGGDGAAFFRT